MEITIVTVRLGLKPQIEKIDGSLEAMQAIVGGYIEKSPCDSMPGVDLICNEEGMSLSLEPNGCGILGSFFFARFGEEGDWVNLTLADILEIGQYVTRQRGKLHPSLLNPRLSK